MSDFYAISWIELEAPNHLPGFPPPAAPAPCQVPLQTRRQRRAQKCGCDCPCNCPPPRPQPAQCSRRPVCYATGELLYAASDLDADGFGGEWGHTRSFANRLSETTNPGNGNNWQVKEWSYLLLQADGSIAVMGQPTQVLWFSKVGDNYGLQAQAIQAGKGNENGDVEQSHHQFKRAVDQALMLRGSRDFASREAYEAFLRELFAQQNAGRHVRLAEELPLLQPLPACRLEACKRLKVRVASGSIISVEGNSDQIKLEPLRIV